MSVMADYRRREYDGAFNLRDLGGYATGDGRSVRWRVLYRADGLHRSPLMGGRAAADLGWRTVVDLRTKREHDAARCRIDGVDVVHAPLIPEIWDEATLAQGRDPIDFLVGRYLEMLELGGATVATAIAIFSNPERLPAVFHCSAGKDRTGVVAAIVLSLLGVPDDVIAADYHLSATAMEPLVAWIVAERPEVAEHMARQPPSYLACPPDAMLTFLEHVRTKHGSIAGYVSEQGVSDETVARLRSALLE
jgi:protein-tyrosine phosphatase